MTKPLFPVDNTGLDEIADELSDKHFEDKRALEHLKKIGGKLDKLVESQEEAAKKLKQVSSTTRQPAPYNPPAQPSRWTNFKHWWQYSTGAFAIKLISGIAVGTTALMGIVFGTIRYDAEKDEFTKYGNRDMSAMRCEGWFCDDIELQAFSTGEQRLLICEDSDSNEKMCTVYYNLPGNNTLVDRIMEKAIIYDRAQGPDFKFTEADANWKADCDLIGCDSILNGWGQWKKEHRGESEQ